MTEQTKAKRESWTEDEDIQVIELSANNTPPCEIATILGKKNRTVVYTRRCLLRREAGTKDPKKVINHIKQKGNINGGRTTNQQISPLADMLNAYDMNFFSNRENKVYEFLSNQAEILRDYDLTDIGEFANLEGNKLFNYLRENPEKKEKFMKIIDSENSSKVELPKTIELISINHLSKPETTLLLPFYSGSAVKSQEGIVSTIYDSLCYILSERGSKVYEGNFRDLAKLRTHISEGKQGISDLEGIQRDLYTLTGDLLKSSEIRIIQDNPFYGFSLDN